MVTNDPLSTPRHWRRRWARRDAPAALRRRYSKLNSIANRLIFIRIFRSSGFPVLYTKPYYNASRKKVALGGFHYSEISWNSIAISMIFVNLAKKWTFFLAHVPCCHFTVNHSFLMILGSQKTLDQALSNEPKYIQNGSLSSELWLTEGHKVQVSKMCRMTSGIRCPVCIEISIVMHTNGLCEIQCKNYWVFESVGL